MKSVDQLIRKRGMLQHPFYQAWSSGKLSLHTLREYAKQYYQLEAAFPRFLSAIHTRCDDRSVRQLLTENLADEELGSENHAELWLRFCEGLGLKREDVLRAPALPETKKAIQDFRMLASNGGHFASGVAAMYAYESQIPEVAKTKRAGLKKFYGVKSERAVKFFRIHEKADVWHSEVERRIMKKYAKQIGAKQLLASAKKGRDALWLFLDGVHRAYC